MIEMKNKIYKRRNDGFLEGERLLSRFLGEVELVVMCSGLDKPARIYSARDGEHYTDMSPLLFVGLEPTKIRVGDLLGAWFPEAFVLEFLGREGIPVKKISFSGHMYQAEGNPVPIKHGEYNTVQNGWGATFTVSDLKVGEKFSLDGENYVVWGNWRGYGSPSSFSSTTFIYLSEELTRKYRE